MNEYDVVSFHGSIGYVFVLSFLLGQRIKGYDSSFPSDTTVLGIPVKGVCRARR